MPAKVKVTISVDAELLRELGQVSRERHQPRSRLVEEALRLWRRQEVERALRDGYVAMAEEDRATAERNLRAGWEAIE